LFIIVVIFGLGLSPFVYIFQKKINIFFESEDEYCQTLKKTHIIMKFWIQIQLKISTNLIIFVSSVGLGLIYNFLLVDNIYNIYIKLKIGVIVLENLGTI
jgi:hypothetical protein